MNKIKTKIKNKTIKFIKWIFLGRIMKESGDYLELSPREKTMLIHGSKAFIKYNLLVTFLILLIIVWIVPAPEKYVDNKIIIKMEDLQVEEATAKTIQTIIKPEELDKKNSQEEEREIGKQSSNGSLNKKSLINLSPEEKYYELIKSNKEFSQYVMGISLPCNNPGNLRYASQPMASNHNGFACFPSIRSGFRSLIKQLEKDQSRNLTLRQFITKYSPPVENDTEWLIKVASRELNLEEGELISYLDTIKLAQYMADQEHSIKIVNY